MNRYTRQVIMIMLLSIISGTTIPQAAAQSLVTVTVDRTTQTGTSEMAVGVTHTQFSLDPWGDGPSIEQGKQLLREGVRYQNQHIYGWGTVNPNPAPGVYHWNSLDRRVQLMRDTGAIPVITLCCAPDWMTSLGTTTSKFPNKPPTAAHYADFANLVTLIAQRYPDVKHYVVWNEMKGLWNRGAGQWDFVAYTALYNAAYDALKAVDPTIQVGGPYLVIDGSATERGAWFTWTPIVRRNLLVLDYWVNKAHGVDFIALDRKVQGYHDNYDYTQREKLALTPTFHTISQQIRERYHLPVWYIEQHFTGQRGGPLAFQAVGIASMLLHQLTGGTAVTVQWEPEQSHDIVAEHLYSSTQVPNGGVPTPNYFVYKLFHDHFPPGTPLFAATSSAPDLEVLASNAATLLLNKRAATVAAVVNGVPVTLAPYEVRLLDSAGGTLQSITHPDIGTPDGTNGTPDGTNGTASTQATDPQSGNPVDANASPDAPTNQAAPLENRIFLPLITNAGQTSTVAPSPTPVVTPISTPPLPAPASAQEATSPSLQLPGSLDATFWDRVTRDQQAIHLPTSAGQVAAAALHNTLVWLQQYSAPASSDRLTALAADSSGVYAAGSTYGALAGPDSHRGYQDAYLRRFDAAGNVLWTRQFGNNGDNGAAGVALYEVGNTDYLYVVGTADSALPGQTSLGSWDGYLRKYDGNGTNLWTVQFGTLGDELATDVAVDETGIYVTGNTDFVFDGQHNSGYQDAFIRKFDHDGNVLWTRQFGTDDGDYAEAIAVGESATGKIIYVGGGTAAALAGQPHAGHWDAFVQAYTPAGDLLWTRQFGTAYDDRVKDIATTAANEAPGIYITGYVEGALPGQSFSGIYDGYARKYDAAGTALWTRQFGTAWNDQAISIDANPLGVYVTGWTLGNLASNANIGPADVMRYRFDLQGNLLHQEQIGAGGQDEGVAIATSLANLYLGGDTNGTMPGQISGGSIDAFAALFQTTDHILVADEFDRTRLAGWRDAEMGGIYTHRGSWFTYPVSDDGGHFEMNLAEQGRAATLAGVSGGNVSILCSVTLNQLATGRSIFTYIAARYQDDRTEYRGQVRFSSQGELFLQGIRLEGGRTTLGDEIRVPDLTGPPVGRKLWVRMEVTGNNPTTLRMKVWPAYTDEPTAWHYTATDSSALLANPGGIGLRTYLPAGVQNLPLRVTFDDLLVVRLE